MWPESESFNDRGLGPIPKRWKGKCIDGEDLESIKKLSSLIISSKSIDVTEDARLEPVLFMIDYEQGTTMMKYIGSTRYVLVIYI